MSTSIRTENAAEISASMLMEICSSAQTCELLSDACGEQGIEQMASGRIDISDHTDLGGASSKEGHFSAPSIDDTVMCTVGKIKLRAAQKHTLNPLENLKDEIVNAFLFSVRNMAGEQVGVMSTFLYTLVEQDPVDFRRLLPYMKEGNYDARDRILMPLHSYRLEHWALAVIIKSRK